MANATATVPQYINQWGDDLIYRGNETLGTAATFYPGGMIALDSNGLAVKCTDVANLKFDGINAGGVSQTVAVGDASATTTITVERPFRFAMAIVGAVQGDEGKPVFALFDNQVAYASGVTNNNFVGYVDKVMSSTQVLIRPAYGGGTPDKFVGSLPALGAVTANFGVASGVAALGAASTMLGVFSDIVITGDATGTVTLDSTANLLKAIPNAETGQYYRLRFMNDASVTLTLAAGDASTTISGPVSGATTVGVARFRDYDMLLTSSSITLTAAGIGSTSPGI